MRKWICGMILALLAVLPACALDLEDWNTDFKTAQKTAAEKKLPMYVLFTGSDWCPYCIRLEKDVLTSPQFKKAVKDKFVLVYLDFPRKKAAPAEAAANRELASKYKISGYPTALILNAEGRELGRIVGTNSARSYVKELEATAKKK